MTNEEFIEHIANGNIVVGCKEHAKKLVAVIEMVSNRTFKHHRRCDIDLDGTCSCELAELKTALAQLEGGEDE